MYGEAAYAETAFGEVLGDLGVPIIPEVVLVTTELVFLIEFEAAQQPQAEE